MPQRRVLVTGASGKLGHRITKLLVDRGDHVIGLGRSPDSVAKIKSLGAEAVEGRLQDVELIKKLASSCDAVLHTAFNHEDLGSPEANARICREDRACIQACIDGLNANKAGTEPKVFLNCGGTFSTNGSTEDARKTPMETHPRYLSEEMTLAAASPTLRTISFRLAPIVHSKEQLHGFIVGMITAARKNGHSTYVGEDNVWPATAYDDAAELAVLAIEKAPAGGVCFHAVDEGGVKTKDIASWVAKVTHTELRQRSPEQAFQDAGFVGMLLNVNNPTSSVKTREWTGWSPKGTGLLEELERRGLKEGE